MTAEETRAGVRLEIGSRIARILVDNPPVNALSSSVVAQLTGALEAVAESDARVVLLSGAGTCFVAGADISEFAALLRDPERVRAHLGSTRPMFQALAKIPQPVVCAVQGFALGGGLEIALCADIVIAHEEAKFGLPEIRLGLIPGGGGTARLPRVAGRLTATRAILLGETLNAREALAAGMVTHVATDDEYEAAMEKLVRRLAEMPRRALAAAKRSLRQGSEMSLEDALALEESLFMDLFETRDAREGYNAFVEKRRPDFE